jgi:hypothetical protein
MSKPTVWSFTRVGTTPGVKDRIGNGVVGEIACRGKIPFHQQGRYLQHVTDIVEAKADVVSRQQLRNVNFDRQQTLEKRWSRPFFVRECCISATSCVMESAILSYVLLDVSSPDLPRGICTGQFFSAELTALGSDGRSGHLITARILKTHTTILGGCDSSGCSGGPDIVRNGSWASNTSPLSRKRIIVHLESW